MTANILQRETSEHVRIQMEADNTPYEGTLPTINKQTVWPDY